MHQNDYASKLEIEARFRQLSREAEAHRLVKIARGTGLHSEKTSFSDLVRRFTLRLLRSLDITTAKVYQKDRLDVSISSFDQRKPD
ncbi:MAG TPA: hypothetical protein VK003_18215 [Oceanobacillus sp.]|nr:hypothetical protein [Oceanobacillus sp.]